MDDKRQAPEVTLESMQVRGASLMLRAAGHFAWQRGYGAFSVSISNVKRVTRYIETQEEHHLKKSYREELVEFLKGHGIAYDERDLDD